MGFLENQALCTKQRYRRYYFPPVPNPFPFATKKQPSDNDVDIKTIPWFQWIDFYV